MSAYLEIKQKISFYSKNNFFKSENDFIASFDIEESLPIKVASFITKNKDYILNNLQITFVESEEDFTIITNADKFSPMLVINEESFNQINSKTDSKFYQSQKDFRVYSTLCGIVLLGLGLSERFDLTKRTENIKVHSLRTELFYYLDEIAELVLNTSSKDDFNLLFLSSDKIIKKVFALGKKYVFSVVLSYINNKVTKDEISLLLGIERSEVDTFLNSYIPVASVSHYKHLNKNQKAVVWLKN